MNDVMSVEEIQAQFESEWVLVGDPETTESLEVKSGNVLWHSKDRDEVYRKARELRPKHSAILYTGTMPEDMQIVLSAFPSTWKNDWWLFLHGFGGGRRPQWSASLSTRVQAHRC